jgi:pyruvate kinase
MSIKFAKTKILATIGPACDSIEKLEALIDAGCDAFRLNFSHGSFEYFEKIFNTINELCVKRSLPVPILIDLQGPKIRIGELSQPEIEIKTNDEIELCLNDFPGTKDKISVSYKNLPKDANIGETILINDGLIRLEVKSKTNKSVKCRIVEGGIIKPRKGMNLPGMKLSTPSVTEKDFMNLEFALKNRVDFIALSFVRSAEDIHHLKKWLYIRGIEKPIIAKIEKPEAIQNFDSILEAADGIMVARGDLGVELAPQLVPIFQKNIIRKCNSVGKLVITATQMMESMIENPVPTRAEASDIANAVWDGTDVVMLSGETSVGKYPVETVKMMNDILLTTESQPVFRNEIKFDIPKVLSDNLFDSMAHAHKDIAEQINAKALIIFTHLGRKAISTAKFRPGATIFAFSDSFDTCNTLSLHWGITPLYLENIDDENLAVENSMKLLLEKNFVDKGDILIFAAGRPHLDLQRISWMRFALAE